MSADLSSTSVDLAREPPFRLGDLEVHPSLSEVAWRGAREALQPRVMQVLVALWRSQGEVVSREAMIDACWGGRVVGDDAIHRCIAQARRLAERTGAFSIETIPRVGHRLSTGAPRRKWRKRALMALATVAAVLLAGGVWTLRGAGAAPSPRVQVTSLRVIGGGPDVQMLAQRLSTDIAGFLTESGVQTTALSPLSVVGGDRRADYRLSGAVQESSGQLNVRIFLEDPRSRLTLWSREFQGPTADAQKLRDAVAAAAAETLYTALEPAQQKGLKLDPETLALHIRGSEIIKSPQLLREGEARRIYEQVTARAPGFAAGHAMLALALVNEVRQANGPARAPLAARAREAAETAIRIDSFAAGAAYDALYLLRRLERPREIAAAEDGLLEGLRRAPEFPFLSMRECRLLTEVGSIAQAMPYCQRAIALRPYAGPIGHSYARAIYVSGEQALAEQAIEQAARHNPDHANVRQTRFELAALSGSAAKARALLHDPTTTPQFIPPAGHAALDAFLLARESGRPGDADAAARDLQAAAEAGRLSPSLAVRALAVLGRIDAAFDVMGQPRFDDVVKVQNGGFLLEPSMAAVRKDARFWPVAARAGLVEYWVARNRWPDFCGSEVELAVCKAAGARALGITSGRAADAGGPRARGPGPVTTRELPGLAR